MFVCTYMWSMSPSSQPGFACTHTLCLYPKKKYPPGDGRLFSLDSMLKCNKFKESL